MINLLFKAKTILKLITLLITCLSFSISYSQTKKTAFDDYIPLSDRLNSNTSEQKVESIDDDCYYSTGDTLVVFGNDSVAIMEKADSASNIISYAYHKDEVTVLNKRKSNGFVFISFEKNKILNTGWIHSDILYYNMGWLYYSPNNCQEIELFTKVISEEENFKLNKSCKYFLQRHVSYLNSLAWCYTEINEFIKAIQIFTKLIDIIPLIPESMFEKSPFLERSEIESPYILYLGRADCKRLLEDYRGALADLDKSIFLNNTNEESYFYRGIVKYNLKDYKGAILDFNKVIDLNSENGLAFYFRGICKLNNSNIESGCLDLSRAGELGNENAYKLIKEYCN
jgi:tetratricopeptide (TPR) repeat protein